MAAFLPLAIDAEPLIAPFIAKGVVWVEHLFHKKPKQGLLKAAMVTAIGKTLSDSLFASGLISSQATEQQIAVLTQSVFQNLNAAGVVNNPVNTTIAATAPMPTIGKSSIPITISGTLNLG